VQLIKRQKTSELLRLFRSSQYYLMFICCRFYRQQCRDMWCVDGSNEQMAYRWAINLSHTRHVEMWFIVMRCMLDFTEVTDCRSETDLLLLPSSVTGPPQFGAHVPSCRNRLLVTVPTVFTINGAKRKSRSVYAPISMLTLVKQVQIATQSTSGCRRYQLVLWKVVLSNSALSRVHAAHSAVT
jgi:hypothetical protein